MLKTWFYEELEEKQNAMVEGLSKTKTQLLFLLFGSHFWLAFTDKKQLLHQRRNRWNGMKHLGVISCLIRKWSLLRTIKDDTVELDMAKHTQGISIKRLKATLKLPFRNFNQILIKSDILNVAF